MSTRREMGANRLVSAVILAPRDELTRDVRGARANNGKHSIPLLARAAKHVRRGPVHAGRVRRGNIAVSVDRPLISRSETTTLTRRLATRQANVQRVTRPRRSVRLPVKPDAAGSAGRAECDRARCAETGRSW